MLKLEKVSKYYFTGSNVVQALRRISLDLKIGEFVAITGKSGSGKSTLLNVLSGLDTYEEGKLYFNGKDISHYTIEELEHYRKDYIGYIFQEYNIINSFTVYQNIELALTIQGYTKEQKHVRVLELIDQVGLTHVSSQKVSKLSGGECQRTVIARTLAKDYQVLVCDEPTGNLNKEASIGIFQLLREISKDKLVIVVTHDISLLQKYATRKIHLYDGEIMEDSQLIPQSTDRVQEVIPKQSHTTFFGAFKIALMNIFSVPKKSLFALLTITFMLAMVFFIYSGGLLEYNKSYASINPYFPNADPSRIILTKDDKSQFTSEELEEISKLNNVRGVFNNDVVFDSVLVSKKFNQETLLNVFYYFKPLSSLALDERSLTLGTLPQRKNEVVVGNDGLYKIGDTIKIANSYLLFTTQSIDTDQFEFIVVGIVNEPNELDDNLRCFYLSNEGLLRIAASSIYENSEISIQIQGTMKFDMATETWITKDMDGSVIEGNDTYTISYPTWIKIDNSLADYEILTFDMLYLNICRDFGYKKEVIDDLDAGLCDANAFINSHTITYRAITTYENDKPFLPITLLSVPYTDNDQSIKLYMNETTYNHFFNESNYQITVIVRGSFEGKQVVKELQNLGYNIFYPSQIVSNEQAIKIIIYNIVVILLCTIIIFIIFFVGHFVLRKIIYSKLKDYLIIRSIGASKIVVRRMLRLEVFFITAISITFILAFVLIFENYSYYVHDMLLYFKWYDYLLLLTLVILVMELMVVQFTRKVFKASVISALKGAE